MIIGKFRYQIEIKTGDSGQERGSPAWLPLVDDSGARRYKFVELYEAEAELTRLKRVQPHAEFRITEIVPSAMRR